MTYNLGDLERFMAEELELRADAAVAERAGEFDLAAMFLAEADTAAWYARELKAAGISPEFPSGEFAVVGVTVSAGWEYEAGYRGPGYAGVDW